MKRFPQDAGLIGRLLLSHPEFRSICEDYAAAQTALALFKARSDAAERPEVAEYEDIIRELEAELADMLKTIRGAAGPDPDGHPQPTGEPDR
ncbi:hypothetical protein DLJ53_04730 [Acuticoccus sediminis]|uniref:Uncharacterized protein n=1 Tax=Acuticoccus sediminis TaxID=2184697 RepID=A0A8B2P1E3_9HYPH|nr:hypothetical protein [Acuticoccus sediminis]RAI03784.1 hypothetical protein DLJ53_04730 [Acuticoccus sediminis]